MRPAVYYKKMLATLTGQMGEWDRRWPGVRFVKEPRLEPRLMHETCGL